MNQIILEGTLHEVMPKQELPKITKQTIIIKLDGKYPKDVAIDILGDKIDTFEFKEGDKIKCFVNIQSREYNEKWYTNITLWKAEKSEGIFDDNTNVESKEEMPF